MDVLSLGAVTHGYKVGKQMLSVLEAVDFALPAGKIVALVAPSGSGKSTVLNIAGLLEKPRSGHVRIMGARARSSVEAARLRAAHVGFVFQSHHLIFELDAAQNVAVPLLLAGMSRRKAVKEAEAMLDAVNLGRQRKKRPVTLSGGEQQRVAVARALIRRPQLILADEPTGNLDPETATLVFDLFLHLTRKNHSAALVVTHNVGLAERADEVITLREHRLLPVSFGTSRL